MSGVYDLSLIVFAYNEADNVGPVLTKLTNGRRGERSKLRSSLLTTVHLTSLFIALSRIGAKRP